MQLDAEWHHPNTERDCTPFEGGKDKAGLNLELLLVFRSDCNSAWHQMPERRDSCALMPVLVVSVWETRKCTDLNAEA